MARQTVAQKRQGQLAKVEELVGEAKGIIEDLTTEVGEVRDNMQGTNLESTERYSLLEECVRALEEINDGLDSALTEMGGVEFP